MSLSTTISRLTGFLRTWAMAYALGVTAIADSYDIANNLPNMIFELVAGGVLSSVFIPVFMEQKERHGDKAAWRFAASVLNVILLILGAIALIGTLWPEPFVRSQTLTLSPEKATLAVHLFRFFAVQIVFYGAALVFTGVLNAYRHFLAPAVAPIFNNVVVTVTLLGFYVPLRESHPSLAIDALAVGTTLGVLTMALVQVPSILRTGYRHVLAIDWRDPAMRDMLRTAGPTSIYVVTNLVCITFRTNFAVATGEGGQAALRYAWQFYQLPYGIFAVALATAVFPELAERAARADWDGFKRMFGRGLRSTATLITPLAVMLVVLARPIITLYRAGRFQEGDVPTVAAVLTWWAAGLLFFATYMYILKTFYALKDTRTPMLTNVAASAVQVSLYAVLTRGIAGWSGFGIIGIPIADGIYFASHLAALMLILRRRLGRLDLAHTLSMLARVVAASLAGGLAAWSVMRATAGIAAGAGFLVQLVLAGTVGLAVTYGLAFALRVEEVQAGVRRVMRALRRGDQR